MLDISRNNFNGSLQGISKLKHLEFLSLFDNVFKGPVPVELGNLTGLYWLDLGSNYFSGSIPPSLGFLAVQGLYLSHNLLSGPIPPELGGMEMVQFLDLSNNNLSREIPSSLGGCTGLQGLDLSKNALQGQIPAALSQLQSLEQFLNLSNNRLEGEIPADLGKLKLLRGLDLSSNMLTGNIPPELGNMTSLKSLNLSQNDLEGLIPEVGILKSFNSSSFGSNDKLCGVVFLMRPCTEGILHSRNHQQHTILVVATVIAASAILLLLFCFAYFIRCYRGRKRKCTMESEEINMPKELLTKFSRRDLENATDSFSADNIIGNSCISTVYKGVLRNGKVVAVKTIKIENSKEVERCFKRELYTMARIRHRNLVKVVGYAWDSTLKALVTDFMPNGNLDALLHNQDIAPSRSIEGLELSERVGISISTAQALVYLHENYDFPIVHCDLKPANILLDEEFEAHVSDFGTARMLGVHLHQESQSHETSSAFRGTIGYLAPEFAYMAKVTPAVDVFSFGIILMELLTRRRPTSIFNLSGSGSDEMRAISLQEWIESSSNDGSLVTLVDPALLQTEEEEKMAVSLLKMSLLCTKPIPGQRPSMRQVLLWLSVIKENHLNDG